MKSVNKAPNTLRNPNTLPNTLSSANQLTKPPNTLSTAAFHFSSKAKRHS